MSEVPPRAPVRPPANDPSEPRYWDPRDLEQEARRTFQVCNDCRMCVTYCGSFSSLFDAIDREVDAGRAEGAEKIDHQTLRGVSDQCWQCKLCYIKCPYTPDEGAYEMLDFPRLMARERAQRARRDGVALVDRILGEPQWIGALGAGPQAKFANLVNANRLVRKLTEPLTGISAEFPLPPLAEQSFTQWFSKHEPTPQAETRGSVLLFPTCYGEYNFSEVPKAAVQVLEKNGFSVIVPDALTCCGMPNLDGGAVESAARKIEQNVQILWPYVERGLRIVVAGPTCGYAIKKEWPLYLKSDPARRVASATSDLMEFLDLQRREKRLNQEFESGLGTVVYHAACHLRAQKVAIPGARVLSRIPNTEVRLVERCSAVDGTWGMKAAHYWQGVRYAQRLTRGIEEQSEAAHSAIYVTDCSLAGLRILKENGKPALHPIQALAKAYGF